MIQFIEYSFVLIIFCILSDILSVLWTKSVNGDKLFPAISASMLIALSSAISIVTIAYDTKYIIPSVIGHGLGTFVGVKYIKVKKEV